MSKLQRPLSVAAVVVTLSWTNASHAQGMVDMPSSPDRSPGINPDTTRGMRGNPAPPTSPASGTGMGASQAYGEGTAGSTLPAPPALPSTADGMPPGATPGTTPGTAGTTTLTSAEYAENVGAEKSKWMPNRPLLITGSAIFVGSYVSSVIVGAISDNDADKKLFIPVAGPWIDLGERTCSFGECSAKDDINAALILGSGVAQAAGVGIMIASLFVPDPAVAKRSASTVPQKAELHVVPASLGKGAGGISAFGTF